MTKDKFISQATSLGYCSKPVAILFAGERESFTEDDFIKVFRVAERRETRKKRHRIWRKEAPSWTRMPDNKAIYRLQRTL